MQYDSQKSLDVFTWQMFMFFRHALSDRAFVTNFLALARTAGSVEQIITAGQI